MASAKTKFAVGLFMTLGMGLTVAAIIWLGVTKAFEKGHHFVSFFDESVQGLNIDSPVKYRGVPVGRVTEIKVAPDGKRIEVVMKINSGYSPQQTKQLVASLQAAGITGSVFIELDRNKEGNQTQNLGFKPDYPVIATRPSDIQQMLNGMEKIIENIKAFDIQKLSQTLDATFANLNNLLSGLNTEKINSQVSAILNNVNKLTSNKKWQRIINSADSIGENMDKSMSLVHSELQKIDKILSSAQKIVIDNRAGISKGMENINTSLNQAGGLLEASTTFVQNSEKSLGMMQNQLLITARNLAQASRNMNRLLEQLQAQPSQIIFSQPKPARQIRNK